MVQSSPFSARVETFPKTFPLSAIFPDIAAHLVNRKSPHNHALCGLFNNLHTCDLLLRRQLLYPAELREHV